MTLPAPALELARNQGRRAGQLYRETGVTQANPYKTQEGRLAALSDEWVTAYVHAGYPAHSAVTAAANGSVMSGAMVALVPADPDVLALDGYEPADTLHLTLLFLGDAVDWSAEAQDRVRASVASLAEGMLAVPGVAFGVAHWNPQGEQPCWVLQIGDAEPGRALLQDVRGAINGAVGAAESGVPFPAQHSPWSPHICLAYTDTTEPLEPMIDRTGPVTFTAVRVAFGGDSFDIPLGSSSE
jgi:2'-5' RNA ligase